MWRSGCRDLRLDEKLQTKRSHRVEPYGDKQTCTSLFLNANHTEKTRHADKIGFLRPFQAFQQNTHRALSHAEKNLYLYFLFPKGAPHPGAFQMRGNNCL